MNLGVWKKMKLKGWLALAVDDGASRREGL
jgi:hypothetical protein